MHDRADQRLDRNPVADFPRRLRINVSAVTLAEAMYRAAADVYGVCVRDWPALDPIAKQTWVEKAERVILSLKPGRVIDFPAEGA